MCSKYSSQNYLEHDLLLASVNGTTVNSDDSHEDEVSMFISHTIPSIFPPVMSWFKRNAHSN